MKRVLIAAITLLAATVALAADKAVIYNHISGPPTALDTEVHKTLDKRFNVIDVKGNDQAYAKPVPREGGMPAAPGLPNGKKITGHVTVVYIVTAEGRAIEPHIVSSTDGRLDKVALEAMKRWRFQPASLGGKPVAVAAAQEFHFH